MGLKNILSCIFLLYGLSCLPQDVEDYVRTFPEKITARIGLTNTSNSFELTDIETGQILDVVPNDKTYLGLSLLFRSIEVDLGYAPNFFSENRDNKGSKLFTLNFRMFLGQWMQTLDFYNQKGFFASIENENIPLPELGTLKIGGSTSYIFNKRFSFRAVGFQNEWQKKSAGSFIPSFTFYYTRFRLEETDSQSNDHSYDIAVGPGYYYNLVIGRHFLIGAGGTLGVGANFTRSEGETTSSALYQVVLRTAIGYNSEHFFMGINLNAQVLDHNDEATARLADFISFGEFYLGYRFNAPKKWVQKADDFNKKYGLD